MTTIYTSLATVKGGFEPICNLYNKKKPAHWKPIRRVGCYEAGFEMDLEDDLLQSQIRLGNTDPNELIRQLRFNRGRLEAGYYIGFTPEQTQLLFETLVEIWGEEYVHRM